MKAVAQIAIAIAPAILAGAFPFIRVVRGGRAWVAFAVCWVLLVAWMFVFSLVIPLVAYQIDRDFGREVATHWVPEGPTVVAMAFFGWFYAGITVLLALLVRRVVQRSGQRGFQTNDAEGAAPNGGPAAQRASSNATEGPPSVS